MPSPAAHKHAARTASHLPTALHPPCRRQVGKTIRVGGWVKTGREAGAGAFAFLEVNDGSCFQNIQVRRISARRLLLLCFAVV